MSNFRKLIGIISKTLFALILALVLLNVTSCDMLDFLGGSQGGSQGTGQGTGQGGDGGQGGQQGGQQKNHYSDYVIINETGKPDSNPEVAWLKDLVWLMYAEKEDIGDWAANHTKTNKIKTILSSDRYGYAWVYFSQRDRLYLNANTFSEMLGFYEGCDDDSKAIMRGDLYKYFTHETMHLVQYKGNAFNLMTGMRPDICAATDLLTEFLAWFYTETRYPGYVITTDMRDAVETQSKYMILATDPWNYDAARAKDPSLPDYIHSTPWFNNEVSGYAQHAFTAALVRESAMTPPLRHATQEDILKIARTLLACRDPKMAGVTDEALCTVVDALRDVATGNSKYLKFGGIFGANQGSYEAFQAFIADWDAAFAAQ